MPTKKKFTAPPIPAQGMPKWGDLLDITAPQHVHVDEQKSPAGHSVLYIHVDGQTVLRICRYANIKISLSK